MARDIHSRYIIKGTLITQSPIHVGGLGGNADTDLALAVDGEGKYYIPGTSLAGALRACMEEIDSKITKFLWGKQEENSESLGGEQEENSESLGGEQEKNYDLPHASFILVEDAVINTVEMASEIRDGVAIDRNWGTAVDKMKFDRAILPKGVKIPLKITLERDADLSKQEWDDYKSLFGQLLSALENGYVSLGAAKTRGLGRVKLLEDKWQVTEQRLKDRTGMLNCLLKGGEQVNWSDLCTENSLFLPKLLEIEIDWEPVGPVMVKAEADGIAVDIMPLLSGTNGSLTFVLPGSAIKGSVRSHSERILRTVCQKNTPDYFAEQIELDLINSIFGEAANKNKELGYRGALGVDDCFAKLPISLKSWELVENSKTESDLRKALNNIQLTSSEQVFHVAIDRWTGGAADSFLYSILEPKGFSWEPINLRLNLKRLQNIQGHYLPCVALILLTLRDLIERRIPLGFGVNRGMGAIKVNHIKFKAMGDLGDLNYFKNLTITNSDFSEINPQSLNDLNDQWQTWIHSRRVVNV